jgi:hypothetical protein
MAQYWDMNLVPEWSVDDEVMNICLAAGCDCHPMIRRSGYGEATVHHSPWCKSEGRIFDFA